ncbi:hypothetical protein LCGC14_2717890 [marine sediment metagenome]|uniref:Uncharacterized protein n=1 Tax=marine sediment metagenome TaxID=412755 RepID=A0A0F8ZAX6_9ZZZZ
MNTRDKNDAKRAMGDHGDSEGLAQSTQSAFQEALEKGYGDPRFYALLEKESILHGAKNKDYAQGGKQGHLGNFTRTSAIKRLYPGFDWSSPFGTAIDYMLKQFDAAMILYSVGRRSVTGENIPERLQDVSVYSKIASLLWEDEQPKLNIKPDTKIITEEIRDQLTKQLQDKPAKDPTLSCGICGFTHGTS